MSSQTVGTSVGYIADAENAFEAGNVILSLRDRKPPIDFFQGDGLRLATVLFWARSSLRTSCSTRPERGGKSTCAALLERFYDPIRGQVLVYEVDLRQLNVRWLRRQLGLVCQEPTLFIDTIAENIAYGLDEMGVAKIARIHHAVSGRIRDAGRDERRAAFRRSEAADCDRTILLLDEATSALDLESEKIVQEALDKVMAMQRRTAIVIAHRLSTIRHANKISVVNGGKNAEQGTHLIPGHLLLSEALGCSFEDDTEGPTGQYCTMALRIEIVVRKHPAPR
ncbi:P-loop containing nucleoside triphosphate hydrolase [Phytophthora cactorum]|nr:P-loop containing nucleoside triphosphate hydrolase [Phytophthora cactorum]